jgi:hypothetical protein
MRFHNAAEEQGSEEGAALKKVDRRLVALGGSPDCLRRLWKEVGT